MNSPLPPTPMIGQGAERGAAPLTSLSLVTNQGSLRLPASGLQHSWRSRKVSRALPTEGLVIPDIPVLNEDGTRQHRQDSWREVIKQWIEGDPKRGLVVPLKDWPPEWYQGANKSFFAMKRHDRGLIAQEFINHYDSNESRFLAAYPQAAEGHTALLRAIKNVMRQRGQTIPRQKPPKARTASAVSRQLSHSSHSPSPSTPSSSATPSPGPPSF